MNLLKMKNRLIGLIAFVLLSNLIAYSTVNAQGTSNLTREFECTISMLTIGTPREVKTWKNVVLVDTDITRTEKSGTYCASRDTLKVEVSYRTTGETQQRLLSTFYRTIEPSTPTNPISPKVFDSQQYDFSLRGLTDVAGSRVELVSTATVTREYIGVGGTPKKTFDITATQVTFVDYNKNTTLAQGPFPPRGASTTPKPNGNSNNPNANTTPPGTPSPDTNTSANFNVNLDEEIGRFWNPFQFESVPELLANILRILFVLIGIAAVVVIIIAGFRMVLASGNEEELTKAKKAITWAIIGLIVSLMSFSIVAIIQRLIEVGAK